MLIALNQSHLMYFKLTDVFITVFLMIPRKKGREFQQNKMKV